MIAYIASASISILNTDVSAVDVTASPSSAARTLCSHINSQLLQDCSVLATCKSYKQG